MPACDPHPKVLHPQGQDDWLQAPPVLLHLHNSRPSLLSAGPQEGGRATLQTQRLPPAAGTCRHTILHVAIAAALSSLLGADPQAPKQAVPSGSGQLEHDLDGARLCRAGSAVEGGWQCPQHDRPLHEPAAKPPRMQP